MMRLGRRPIRRPSVQVLRRALREECAMAGSLYFASKSFVGVWAHLSTATIFCAVLTCAVATAAPGFAAGNGWQAEVGKALGKTGAMMPGGIYRVGLPRTDLKATLDGV